LNEKQEMFKTIIAKLFSAAGILRFLRWYNRNRILILYLHSVVDLKEMPWRPLRTPFSIDLLRRQLEIISRHYTWLTLDDAVEMLAGQKPLVPNGIVLTFDDGYRNNMSIALPVLERYSIKPVFYVATGMLNNRMPYWFERLDFAIQQLREPTQVDLQGRSFHFQPGDRDSLRESYAALRQAAKKHFDNDRQFYEFFNNMSDRLEKSSGKALAAIQAGDPCSETLSDDDLRSLSTSGRATVGSHTVDHFRLDTVDEELCADELTRAKKYIEEVTGTVCRHFCYPNGNWNRSVADAVAAAGYDSAVTTADGFNSVGDDLYSLKRLHMPQSSDAERLLLFMSGLSQLKGRLIALARG
jgi:peptidoglycan/xylan/chitin deacetylase (PgdA/CDA1 family)